MTRNLFLFGCVLLALSNSAKAAVVFNFDMDLSTAGIQPTRTTTPGLTFDIGLFMSLTDPADVTSFAFNVGFNNQFVTVNSVSIPVARPTGYEQLAPVTINNPGGIVGIFSGGPPFGPTLVAPPSSSLNLGVLSITTTNSTAMNSTGTILQFINTGSDIFPAPTFSSSASTLVVTAVPEPASLLCITFFATVVGLNVRRRKGFKSPTANS